MFSPLTSCYSLSALSFAYVVPSYMFSPVGWGIEQGVGGFGDDPGVKAQILNLIRSVRTVMRGWKTSLCPKIKVEMSKIIQNVKIRSYLGGLGIL